MAWLYSLPYLRLPHEGEKRIQHPVHRGYRVPEMGADLVYKVKIYLYVIDKNTIQYSLDKISWEELNKKLGLELLDMSNYCENIVVLTDNKEMKEND